MNIFYKFLNLICKYFTIFCKFLSIFYKPVDVSYKFLAIFFMFLTIYKYKPLKVLNVFYKFLSVFYKFLNVFCKFALNKQTNSVYKFAVDFLPFLKEIYRKIVIVAKVRLVSDPPKVSLQFGANIDFASISEGNDVYFDCKIRSNPKIYKVEWHKNVSKI